MITNKYQTMTLSSPGSLNQLKEVKLSCFIGYIVGTQTIPSLPIRTETQPKETVKNSLERSLKDNADVWAELSKH